ncbi:zinc ribbon domain-containing protein [Clostridium sp. DJ247]|uniref:zinc ribbon domain-containing protein n=1 Tax=Clostridium sp. DJ247 TaxID=2726188 RepID=UPI00162682C6|nr:zinc ribbon domain-containing protein [Clostridium sp. DJ247]MBC2581851.1 zinc ribbon domain-containing protein [Clostridium sp. DJ247]
MFLLGVFGINDKQKEIKTISDLSCKNCSMERGLKLVKQYTVFHVFFIPIFKWNERYYLYCNNCRTLYEVSKEKGSRAEAGEENAITYWDLKPLENTYYDSCAQHRCNSCGRAIESNFEYCPYCGKKQI